MNSVRERQARRAWERYCASGRKPADIPERPDLAYPDKWKGWVDWVGWHPGIEIPNPLDALIHEYRAWNATNGLSLGSADEHLFDENLTDEQRAWLKDFSRRWEEAS